MTPPRFRKTIDVFADYYQVYLWDAERQGEIPTDWTDADVANRGSVRPGVAVVSPVRNMTVPITIEVYEAEPECDEAGWDHIAEAALDVPSGRVEVYECCGSAVGEVPVAPGMNQVRILMGKLDSLSEDGLDGDDHYTVQFWPGPERAFRVVKLHPVR